MGFYDAFFGSDQSLYTAYAIIAAIIAICVTILFTSTDIPVGSRLLMILFVVITLVPSIFLTLFEITCIVTGGTEPNNWWCYTFAWILAAFIIIYCIFVVIISIMSLVTYNKAIDNVNNDEEKNKVNPPEANNIAKQIMATQKPIEKFYNNPDSFQIPGLGLGSLINDMRYIQEPKPKVKEGYEDMSQMNDPYMNSDLSLSSIVGQQPSEEVKKIDEGDMDMNNYNYMNYDTKEGYENQKNNTPSITFSVPIIGSDTIQQQYLPQSIPQSMPQSQQQYLPQQPRPISVVTPQPKQQIKSIPIAGFANYDNLLGETPEDTLATYPGIFENK